MTLTTKASFVLGAALTLAVGLAKIMFLEDADEKRSAEAGHETLSPSTSPTIRK